MAYTKIAVVGISLALSWVWMRFSLWFTVFCGEVVVGQFVEGPSVYLPANWTYTSAFFDNTALTYVTDFAVFLWMAFCALQMSRLAGQVRSVPLHADSDSQKMQEAVLEELARCFWCCFWMLVLYAWSVLVGGITHATLEGRNEVLNGFTFRILWTLTVGSVTLASWPMGAAGTALMRFRRARILEKTPSSERPKAREGDAGRFFGWGIIPNYAWLTYAALQTLFLVRGDFSFQRPAADIFVAGTTQALSSVYICLSVCLAVLDGAGASSDGESKLARAFTIWAFALNAPLLVVYPVLVSFLPLGQVNCTLHAVLAVAWGGQWLSLHRVGRLLSKSKAV